MKKLFSIFIIAVLILSSAGCSLENNEQEPSINDSAPESLGTAELKDSPTVSESTTDAQAKVLSAFFSCTGTTKQMAEYVGQSQKADFYVIIPEVPYTQSDLAYYTGGRADQEQNDPTARPAINGMVENMADYSVVFIGYPIWHGQAPTIISTFLESYDFSGKTVIPFCTSHSSGIGSSATNLHTLAENANWLDGHRFGADADFNEIREWVDSLGLSETR